MNVKEYLEKLEKIRKDELLSKVEIAREINISYNTLTRLSEKPDSCALKTMKKIKNFVENRMKE